MVGSPINPAVLDWALAEDGRAVSDLAERVGVPATDIHEWLIGEETPTQGQLTKLAEVLSRPRATFLLPRPPESSSTAFRQALGSNNVTSSKARRIVRESRQVQKALTWIRRRDMNGVSMPQSRYSDPVDSAAAEMRNWAGVSIADQFRWKDDYAALRAWRQALDDRGVLVFELPIGRGEIRGFSSWDDWAPIVGVNITRTIPAARIYTLAHELGHLACREASACDDFDTAGVSNSKRERWCERFASSFLMPVEAVKQAIDEYRARSVEPPLDVDEVKELTRRFRVSARAAAIRLENLEIADPGLYARVNRIFKPRDDTSGKSAGFSPPRSEMRIRQYGVDVVQSILTSLPPQDAFRVLRIDALDARRLSEMIPGLDGI